MAWMQFMAVIGLSLRRFARSRFMLANTLLSCVPILIAGSVAVKTLFYDIQSDHDPRALFELMLRVLFLHFSVFFVANIFGFASLRQESDDQTLHYLLLQPIARPILVAGKFAAYLILAAATCLASLWATYAILMLSQAGLAEMIRDLFDRHRLVALLWDSAVLVLGLIAYGSIALLMGSFFKSAFYALILLGWESTLPYLPSTLKFWTISHYLHSLLPERLAGQKIFEMLGDPASTPLSLGVLLILSLVLGGIATALFQNRECMYGDT